MFQGIRQWWQKLKAARQLRRVAKERNTKITAFTSRYFDPLYTSKDQRRIFDRALSGFPSEYDIGMFSFDLYIHPFIFSARYSFPHTQHYPTKCGIVLDSSKFNMRTIQDCLSDNPKPESRDADWFTFELDMDSPHWEVLPEFLEHIDALIEREKSAYYQKRAAKDAEKIQAVHTQFERLLAETRMELPSRELLTCPQCGGHFLLPRSHGKLMYCTNCTEESVLVEHGDGELALEKIQPLLV